MSEDKEKAPSFNEIFKLRILGLDFGEMLRNWFGVSDPGVLKDPNQVENLQKRIEEQRIKLKDAQEKLRKRFGDAVRFDYDIKIRSPLIGGEEVRVGGGRFFEKLDELSREQNSKGFGKAFPYMKKEGVIEPFTEVIDNDEHVEVIMELPGVEENEIEFKVDEGKAYVSTPGPEKTYRAEVDLPTKVMNEPTERSYKNGILKVRLKKVREERSS